MSLAEPYLDAVGAVDFFKLVASLFLSSFGAVTVLYLEVYVGVAGVDVFASRLIALRYVPPEYDGRYEDGDEIEPKRGVDLLSDNEYETSSRDEYCN